MFKILVVVTATGLVYPFNPLAALGNKITCNDRYTMAQYTMQQRHWYRGLAQKSTLLVCTIFAVVVLRLYSFFICFVMLCCRNHDATEAK